MSGHKWRPLVRADQFKEMPRELVDHWMKLRGCDEAEARRLAQAERDAREYWVNDLYQVEVRRDSEGPGVWLCIRRRDGYVGRDWRHFQLIKNQLLGEECEAVELYPAESRLVDTSNKYHLFGSTDPTFRFPFGYMTRDVDYTPSDVPGLRQAPPMKHARERVIDKAREIAAERGLSAEFEEALKED